MMIDPHRYLRAATRSLHVSTEAAFQQFDLAQPDGYRAFLIAQAGALLPLERAADASGIGRLLSDWPERRRGELLRADLDALGIVDEQVPGIALPNRSLDPLGLAYVLEGSRHGAWILLRRVVKDRNPAAAGATAFLGQPFDAGRWTSFLTLLGRERSDAGRHADLAGAAEEAFRAFERSAVAVLDRVRRSSAEN